VYSRLYILIFITLVSCNQETLYLNNDYSSKDLDTFYIESPPIEQPKKVILFGVHGVRCSNSPDAISLGRSLSSTYSERLEVISLYPNWGLLTFPWPGGYDTLNTISSDMLIDLLYGKGSYLPLGSVDHGPYVDRNYWNVEIQNRLKIKNKINLELKTVKRPTPIEYIIQFKAVANSKIDTSFNIIVGIIENDVDSRLLSENNFIHHNVLRNLISKEYGEEFNMVSVPAGYVRVKNYHIRVDPKWNWQNCKIVAWAYNTITKQVDQVTSYEP
jgi:hypothetical protein